MAQARIQRQSISHAVILNLAGAAMVASVARSSPAHKLLTWGRGVAAICGTTHKTVKRIPSSPMRRLVAAPRCRPAGRGSRNYGEVADLRKGRQDCGQDQREAAAPGSPGGGLCGFGSHLPPLGRAGQAIVASGAGPRGWSRFGGVVASPPGTSGWRADFPHGGSAWVAGSWSARCAASRVCVVSCPDAAKRLSRSFRSKPVAPGVSGWHGVRAPASWSRDCFVITIINVGPVASTSVFVAQSGVKPPLRDLVLMIVFAWSATSTLAGHRYALVEQFTTPHSPRLCTAQGAGQAVRAVPTLPAQLLGPGEVVGRVSEP